MPPSNRGLREKTKGNLGQKLMRAARLMNERALTRMQDKGHPLRQAHTRLLPHLNFDGSRLTEVAERAGITKQSAQRLVDEMEKEGYLAKMPDPDDGRAKMIVYTDKGRKGVLDGLRVLSHIEDELVAGIGEKRLRVFATTLDAILSELETEGGP